MERREGRAERTDTTRPHARTYTYLVLGVFVEELGVNVEDALEVEGPQAQHLVEVHLGLHRAEDGRERVNGLVCGGGVGWVVSRKAESLSTLG